MGRHLAPLLEGKYDNEEENDESFSQEVDETQPRRNGDETEPQELEEALGGVEEPRTGRGRPTRTRKPHSYFKDMSKILCVLYKMMYNEDIASIPVKKLLFPSCLVAIWCTNAPSNIAAVKDLIFPKWGVEYITTWYWLKVNIDLQPLCDFGYGCKKQPYERLILGKIGNIMNVPENHLVVSIPSALHSHKPPLLDLLKPFVAAKDPQVLELFARYLLPNTTSVGFEPLKWQHVSLYDKVS
ncbi:methyltransferase-like protein 4 [Hyposmocoma kahamanoa]|uniref:methyltransferase-like protein 4 n=1 Tax=Hyposmocoma kahamanoa TaxID=1477025 RepID=UPI000E6D65D2|nr:methyltransferase-like protein 4 [Hyposmocoma kahamanoa]